MSNKRIIAIEISIGSLFIVIGVGVWWWSKILFWILVYPQPVAKQLIENLPFLFWGLSALLIADGIKRILLSKDAFSK